MHQASHGQNPMIESMKRIRDAALRQSKRLARWWEEQAWPMRLYSGGGLVILSALRSEEHTSELQSLMRISYAVFCLKKKKTTKTTTKEKHTLIDKKRK